MEVKILRKTWEYGAGFKFYRCQKTDKSVYLVQHMLAAQIADERIINFFSQMIDLFFILLLIVAAFKGMRKGFVLAVFSFLSIIIGLAAALKLSATVASHLHWAIALPS